MARLHPQTEEVRKDLLCRATVSMAQIAKRETRNLSVTAGRRGPEAQTAAQQLKSGGGRELQYCPQSRGMAIWEGEWGSQQRLCKVQCTDFGRVLESAGRTPTLHSRQRSEAQRGPGQAAVSRAVCLWVQAGLEEPTLNLFWSGLQGPCGGEEQASNQKRARTTLRCLTCTS